MNRTTPLFLLLGSILLFWTNAMALAYSSTSCPCYRAADLQGDVHSFTNGDTEIGPFGSGSVATYSLTTTYGRRFETRKQVYSTPLSGPLATTYICFTALTEEDLVTLSANPESNGISAQEFENCKRILVDYYEA